MHVTSHLPSRHMSEHLCRKHPRTRGFENIREPEGTCGIAFIIFCISFREHLFISVTMFANPFNHIKNSVRSGFVNLKLRSSEPISIPIITDPHTGKMTVPDRPKVILESFAHVKSAAIMASHKEFDSSSSSSLDQSEQATPLLESSSSGDSTYSAPLFPNSRLFRGSQVCLQLHTMISFLTGGPTGRVRFRCIYHPLRTQLWSGVSL